MTRQEDKMITIPLPDEEWVLEGIFIRGEGEELGGAVIAAPHPLYGGSMDSPVVSELTWSCKRCGYATARFNWRGVGASGGAPSGDAADADADYGATLAHLEATVDGPMIAAGYSFGAATAVRVAATSPRVRRLLLVAPPPALLDTEALAGFRGSVLAIVGTRDEFAPVVELEALLGDGPRRRLEVIPEADHFFMQGLADISRHATDWLGGGRA